MIGQGSIVLAVVWTGVMILSAGVAVREAVLCWRDYRILEAAISSGEPDPSGQPIRRYGGRWWFAVGFGLANGAVAACLVLFATAGVVALSDPDSVHPLRAYLVTWALFLGGILVAAVPPIFRRMRQRIRGVDAR